MFCTYHNSVHLLLGFRLLESELASLTTPAKCGYYIQVLRESIWPDGQLAGSETVVSESKKEMTRQLARQRVYDYLPGSYIVQPVGLVY